MDAELYRAALSGDIIALREKERILGVGDQLSPDKNTVLHVASQSGKIEFVQEILSMHPSLLCNSNSRGETALQLAAREGHSHIVKALIDEAKRSLMLPLEKDVENGVGSSSTLKVMLSMANVEGDTALHEAARYNHVDVVKMLLEEDCADESLHTLNKATETPLYLAACRGYALLVKTICETCSPLAYGGPDGRTSLHAAIINECNECVTYLLEWKKDLIKETDNHGWSAFHYAAYYGQDEMIQGLLEVDKSMVYLVEMNGNRTALHIAAIVGSINVMEKLIAFCPDCCYMIDKRGRNILHFAVENNQKEMIRYILENCPIISNLLVQKDIDGNTPLHLLSILGRFSPEIIQHKMADKEALNKENLTPMESLQDFGDRRIAEQVHVIKTLHDVGANRVWDLGKVIRNDGTLNEKKDPTKLAMEEAEEAERLKKIGAMEEAKKAEKLKKIGETHMIVAALVVTITFTAGFTIPGPNQGLAILARKEAFKAFMITDAIAFLLATSSLLLYFFAAGYNNSETIFGFYSTALFTNIVAIGAMMVAFITGTYVVLAHSLGLAVTVCVIGCCFFVVLFFVMRKDWRDP